MGEIDGASIRCRLQKGVYDSQIAESPLVLKILAVESAAPAFHGGCHD